MAPPKAKTSWEIMAERNQVPIEAPAPPPESGGRGWSDPVEAGVSWLSKAFESMTPEQRRAFGMPAGPMPDWVKTAGRFVIPQNTPEALLALAMLPMGGPLAARGVPFAAKLAQKGVAAAVKRALATGALTGLGGTVTGHDPLHSIGTGVIGRPAGEMIGHAAGKVVQGVASSRLFQEVTPNLVNVFKQTIGKYLPEGATDAGVLREVISDSASKRVGAAIKAAKERLAKKPVKAIDLKPVVTPDNGVVYAWPTEPGTFPRGVGAGVEKEAGGAAAGTVQGGRVWPPVRDFESKLTPGEGLAPFGALERPGELTRIPPKGQKKLGPGEGGPSPLAPDEVEFGPLWDEVDKAYQATELALRENPGDGKLATRLETLKQVRQTLVDRVADPDLKNLFHDYGLTKSLRDLFWGARKAPAKFGEDVVKELIDDAGNLTQKGAKIVYDRLNTDAPNIAQQLGEETTQRLKDAVGLKSDLGLASPVPGQGPQLRVHAGPGGIHPGAGLEGARVPSYPGWESTRTAAEKLAPGALKVLGAPTPAKVVTEAEAQAAEGGEPSAPPSPGVPTEKLRENLQKVYGVPREPGLELTGGPPTPLKIGVVDSSVDPEKIRMKLQDPYATTGATIDPTTHWFKDIWKPGEAESADVNLGVIKRGAAPAEPE